MRIAIAGSSGFLGTHLREALSERGHEVVRLVRRPAKAGDEAPYDPTRGDLDPAVLSTVDGVVNLAGVGVGDRRWTPAYKALIRSSRVAATDTLARALAEVSADGRPRVFLSQSGINYYGDTGDRPVDEQSPSGKGYLTEVCLAWEAATQPADAAGVRVIRMRTGLPLGRGGLLKPMLLPFRLGLGGPIGGGRAYMPWLSIVDWQRIVLFLLERDDIAGPVDVVGPDPVTNAEFTKALAAAVHRPAFWPIPQFAVRLAMGEFVDEALKSMRVLPGVLTKAGYEFRHRDIYAAMREAVAG